MKTEEYLKKYQPIAFELFSNALTNNSFFHAYLLSGEKGSSLNKISLFLAKSLLCEKSNFACESCQVCLKVENNQYEDLLIFDPKNESLKVNELRESIENLATKTANSKSGIKVYIINNIEYLSNIGINMLLKFLEEPPKNTYAIFTSESINNVLPTIRSRTEIVRFSNIDKHIFVNWAKNDGLENNKLFFYASLIVNDYDEIISLLKNPSFLEITKVIIEYINRLIDKNSARFYVESNIIKLIKDKNSAYLFYDLLIALFKESLHFKYNKTITFREHQSLANIIVSNIKDINEAIKILLEDEYQIKNNLNLNLLLIHSLTSILSL